MGRRSEDDFDEPDYEAIAERRREYRQEDRADRAERSYERYMTGE